MEGSAKKRQKQEKDACGIYWEKAEKELPGISALLRNSISDVHSVAGELYAPESDPCPNEPDVIRDEECWLPWEGTQFDFMWYGKRRSFVTRDVRGGDPDCVLKLCCAILEPLAQAWPCDLPFDEDSEECTKMGQRAPGPSVGTGGFRRSHVRVRINLEGQAA